MSAEPALDVVVGIVTHRRPDSLAVLLDELGRQQFPGRPAPRYGVVVVDNSPDREGRAVVERAPAPGAVPVRYVPLGAGNISAGRNAVLDATCSLAPLVALVDDDEIPAPDWLHRLLDTQQRTSADVVSGPVRAEYPDGTPAWLRRADLHSVPVPAGGGPVDEAYTCNVLVRSELVRRLGLRFDEALGVSGGEDQLFFRQAGAAGARMVADPAAVVRDPVPPARTSPRYLARREFRMGGTLGLLDRSRPGWPAGRPLLRLVRAGWWAAGGAAAVLRAVPTADRAGALRGVLRIARAGGMLHGLAGGTYQLYAAGSAPTPSGSLVAVVADEGPGYQQAGHSRHLQGLVSHLAAAGHRVVLVVPGSRTGFLLRRDTPGTPAYRSPSLRTVGRWQVLVAPRAVAAQLAWQLFRRLPRSAQRTVDRARTALRSRRQVDHVLGSWPSAGTSAWTTATLADLRPDAVLFNTVFTVPEPPALPSSVRWRAVVSHDVVHERAASFRAAGHRVQPADFTAEDEGRRLAAVDAVLAIQQDDARSLARLAPHARVLVTPVVVDTRPLPRGDTVPGRCLFVGSGSLHNLEALTWFLTSCWPEVLRQRPGSELHVVGTVCARLPHAPAGVRLRGEVPDLTEEYRRAQVAIAPLRTGSGLKVKAVEALSTGVATVTTSVGAQGLGHLTPRPYLLADTAADFAAAVVDVLADGDVRHRVEAAAAAAAPLFSAEHAYRELDEALRVALAEPTAAVPEEEPACVPVS